ncbi:LAFA_0B04808g1_1 [Lachancea sp. 'fantastica']|nr:LAFA_0B04808g1_1 [Lachancea sp. 'fantastica']
MIPIRRSRCYCSLDNSSLSRIIAINSAKSFQQSLSSNLTLAKLAKAYQNGKFAIDDGSKEISDDLNSTRTLPLVKLPKNQIFNEVLNDPKVGDWRKPATKWFRLGKSLLKMYMNGIKSTWKVYFGTRKLMQGSGASRSIVTSTYRNLEFQQIQNRVKSDDTVNLGLTRKQFQEIHRRQEFWKLPVFLILFLVFEETLPFICYLVPSLVPWNCLTPGAFKKLSERRIASQQQLPYQNSGSDVCYTTPYALQCSYTSDLLKSFKMLSSTRALLYSWSGNNNRLCELLARFHQYLVLDDWFLLQSILNTNEKTILSQSELVNAILERQLYRPGEDLNQLVSTEYGQKVLAWRLIIYWSFRFQGTITTGGTKTFSELWGVNNIGILNYPGSQKLVDESSLRCIEVRD